MTPEPANLTLSAFLVLLRRRDSEPWPVILRRDPCSYCNRLEADIPGGQGRKWQIGNGNTRKMTIEHVVPKGLELQRPAGVENKVAACWNCNHTRNNLPLLAYLLWRQHQKLRFQPGPSNARNRVLKARKRQQKERRRNQRASAAPGLRWGLAVVFPSELVMEHVEVTHGD